MGKQQTYTQKPSRKQKIYTIANNSWTITCWIWTSIIIVFFVQWASNLTSDIKINVLLFDLQMLSMNSLDGPENVIRLLCIILLPSLASITVLSWMLKHNLQEEPEGLDKLIKILEYDTITPQIEKLQEELQQSKEAQLSSVEYLKQIDDRLKKMPTVTDLQDLRTLASRQDAAWKKFDQALQNIHIDIHIQTREQQKLLDNLFQQSQKTGKTISTDLRAIASILEQSRDKVAMAALSEPPVNTAKSNQNE